MATVQRMTTSTITIATDNGFEDNDGDDATGNDDDVDGNGATEIVTAQWTATRTTMTMMARCTTTTTATTKTLMVTAQWTTTRIMTTAMIAMGNNVDDNNGDNDNDCGGQRQ